VAGETQLAGAASHGQHPDDFCKVSTIHDLKIVPSQHVLLSLLGTMDQRRESQIVLRWSTNKLSIGES
jgi:hypothetical protein